MSEEIPVLPMEEALAFWRKKVALRPKRFYRLAEEYRVYAFTVAKLGKLKRIKRVMESLDDALAQGQSMEEWRDGVKDVFKKAGWTGNRYRLDTIYRTNIQTALNAGRWAQAQDGKSDRPYGMYDAVLDGRTRPTHAAQDGKIYPLDHPFWSQWWPPNGFRCRCSVRTLTKNEADRMGGVQDKIEGAPDEGFQTNPGHTPGEARFLRNIDITKELDDQSAALRQSFLDAAKEFPFFLHSDYLSKRDQESIKTLLWAQKQGGVEGYEGWIDMLYRDRSEERKTKSGKIKGGGIMGRGRIYPMGNLPDWVTKKLDITPRLTLIIIQGEDVAHLARSAKVGRGQALSEGEVKGIPMRLHDKDVRWFEGQELIDDDRPDLGEVVASLGEGKDAAKIAIHTNFRIKGVTANVVRTSGLLRGHNLENDPKYKEIKR